MPQDYYPSGPFLGGLPDKGEFDLLREDFLLGFKESTARAYKADLEDYLEWCISEAVDPLKPANVDSVRYGRSLESRGYSTATQARRRSALRRFLHHAMSRRNESD